MWKEDCKAGRENTLQQSEKSGQKKSKSEFENDSQFEKMSFVDKYLTI